MNDQLQAFARFTLKLGLEKCTEGQHLTFKRMYSHLNLDRDINAVVDDMPEDRLNLAMEQVRRSVEANESSDHDDQKKSAPDKCEQCGAPTGQTEDGRTRFDSSQYHMAAAKKLSEISLLRGGWLDAIKAIDWMEREISGPCEPYPQSERDEDREWLISSSPTPDPEMKALRNAFSDLVLRCADEGVAIDDIFEKHGLEHC